MFNRHTLVPFLLLSTRIRRSQTILRKQFKATQDQIISNYHRICEYTYILQCCHSFRFLSLPLCLLMPVCLFLLRIHILSYGIANSAYRSLQDQNENQCICIVGENGSGKTESARIILHFLSNVHSEHTLTGKHIFHNQNSTRLQRCKSLAAYPKYESTDTPPSQPTRRDSIKNAHKSHVSIIQNKKDIQFDDIFKIIVFLLQTYSFGIYTEISRNC